MRTFVSIKDGKTEDLKRKMERLMIGMIVLCACALVLFGLAITQLGTYKSLPLFLMGCYSLAGSLSYFSRIHDYDAELSWRGEYPVKVRIE